MLGSRKGNRGLPHTGISNGDFSQEQTALRTLSFRMTLPPPPMQELDSQIGTWELQRRCLYATNDLVMQMGVSVWILLVYTG